LKPYLTQSNYFNFLLAIFPLSFIAGNLIININLVLLVISGLIIFKSKIFQINNLEDKLIFIFFLLIIFTGALNDYNLYQVKVEWSKIINIDTHQYFETIIKSFLFLKYFLFYLIIKFLIEQKIINLKYFFITCSFGALFVSLDIILQFLTGRDIFGYEIIPPGRKLGGPFNDELIAGGYIQRFSIFIFFLIPVFYNESSIKKKMKILIPILFIIIFIGLILSGNRISLIIFSLIIFLIIVFQKQVRKYIVPAFVSFVIIFSIFYKFNNQVKMNFKNFSNQIYLITSFITDKNNKDQNYSYVNVFQTFYGTWQMNKFLGGGIKNYRYYCHERPKIKENLKYHCNMHPHNYYLEILTETGIIGFSIIILILALVTFKSFFRKYFLSSFLNENNLIIPFIFLFIGEFFPFRSTGSFFTTGNSTYIILIMAILIGLSNNHNLIDKKN
jgi:O-antigen ligase